MRRSLPISTLAILFAIAGCRSDARKRHEALAAQLAGAAADLCRTSHAEAGGCYRDCMTRLRASEGRSAVFASQAFAAVPVFADPETEALLAELRTAARSVRDELASVCDVAPKPDAPITPELERCAQARDRAGPALAKLRKSYDALAERTEDRTGVALPGRPCPRD